MLVPRPEVAHHATVVVDRPIGQLVVLVLVDQAEGAVTDLVRVGGRIAVQVAISSGLTLSASASSETFDSNTIPMNRSASTMSFPDSRPTTAKAFPW
jgi:hypothetical protein